MNTNTPTGNKAAMIGWAIAAAALLVALATIGGRLLRTDLIRIQESPITLSTAQNSYQAYKGTTLPVVLRADGVDAQHPLLGMKLTLVDVPSYATLEPNSAVSVGTSDVGRIIINKVNDAYIIVAYDMNVTQSGEFLRLDFKISPNDLPQSSSKVRVFNEAGVNTILVSEIATKTGTGAYISQTINSGTAFTIVPMSGTPPPATATPTASTPMSFKVTAPASVKAGEEFDVTVCRVDPVTNQPVTSYRGKILFFAQGYTNTLPFDNVGYTFTENDQNGCHTFVKSTKLTKVGSVELAVADVNDPNIAGKTTVTVTASPSYIPVPPGKDGTEGPAYNPTGAGTNRLVVQNVRAQSSDYSSVVAIQWSPVITVKPVTYEVYRARYKACGGSQDNCYVPNDFRKVAIVANTSYAIDNTALPGQQYTYAVSNTIDGARSLLSNPSAPVIAGNDLGTFQEAGKFCLPHGAKDGIRFGKGTWTSSDTALVTVGSGSTIRPATTANAKGGIVFVTSTEGSQTLTNVVYVAPRGDTDCGGRVNAEDQNNVAVGWD